VFSDKSKEHIDSLKLKEREHEMLANLDYSMKTLRFDIISIGISLICQTYTEKRKEFAFLYIEDLKFLILEAEQRREI
jgi:hypothetical protein